MPSPWHPTAKADPVMVTTLLECASAALAQLIRLESALPPGDQCTHAETLDAASMGQKVDRERRQGSSP